MKNCGIGKPYFHFSTENEHDTIKETKGLPQAHKFCSLHTCCNGATIATEDRCRVALARCLCHVPMLCETDNKCFIKRLLPRSAPSRVEMIFVYRVHHNIATSQQQQQKYELLLKENTMDDGHSLTQLRHTYYRLHTLSDINGLRVHGILHK